MINAGLITIAGGGGGASLGSGVSGILTLNSQAGPHINITSVDSTIDISAAANVIDLSCSGFISGVQTTIINDLDSRLATSGQILLQEISDTEVSGIQTINGENGPDITHQSSDNTIDITVPSADVIDHSVSGFVSGVQTTLYNDLGGRIETSGQLLLQEITDSEVSGIQTINGEDGPDITHQSADGTVDISVPSADTIDHSVSGFVSGVQVTLYNDLGTRLETSGQILLQSGGGDGSGLNSINGETGPHITIDSADGSVEINTTTNNIDLSASGYMASGFIPRADFDWNGFLIGALAFSGLWHLSRNL